MREHQLPLIEPQAGLGVGHLVWSQTLFLRQARMCTRSVKSAHYYSVSSNRWPLPTDSRCWASESRVVLQSR